MSHEALGGQFDEHVANFRDRFHEFGYHHPSCARGECLVAAIQFERSTPGAKRADFITKVRGRSYTNHSAVEMPHPETGEPHVIDFTMRQFDKDAPYPVVMPRADYQQKYDMRDDPHGWEEDPSKSPNAPGLMRHGTWQEHHAMYTVDRFKKAQARKAKKEAGG